MGQKLDEAGREQPQHTVMQCGESCPKVECAVYIQRNYKIPIAIAIYERRYAV